METDWLVDDMKCQICGVNDSDYTCSKCGKNICYKCARKLGEQVLCVQCAGVPAQPKKSDGLQKAMITVLILFVGMVAILYILEYYLGSFTQTLGIDVLMIGSFKDVAMMITEAVGVLLAILAIIYIVRNLKKPTKSL